MDDRTDLKKQADEYWTKGKRKKDMADSLLKAYVDLTNESDSLCKKAQEIYNKIKIESPQFKKVE